LGLHFRARKGHGVTAPITRSGSAHRMSPTAGSWAVSSGAEFCRSRAWANTPQEHRGICRIKGAAIRSARALAERGIWQMKRGL
jgi:hypothetical protein